MTQVANNKVSAAHSPMYLQSHRTEMYKIPSGSTWANKIISMDYVEQHGIMYDIDAGVFTLEAGVTYRITAQLGFEGDYYRSGKPTFYAFGLFSYHRSGGEQIGPLAESLSIGANSSNASGGVLDVIHTPLITRKYCIKMAPNVVASSSSILRTEGAFLNIVQVMPCTETLSARRFTNQQISSGSTWANRNIIMRSDRHDGSIEYDENTGEFTLNGGVTYRITAQLGWLASTPGWYAFGLFDAYTNKQIGPLAESLSPNMGTSNASGGILDVIYTPLDTRPFCLRMSPNVTADSSSRIRFDVSTFLNIVSIPEEKSYMSARRFARQIPTPDDHGNKVIKMHIQEKIGTIEYSPDSGTFTLEGGKTYRITAQLGWEADIPGYYRFGCYDGEDILAVGESMAPSYPDGYLIAPATVLDAIIAPSDTIECTLYVLRDAGISSKIRADVSTFMNIVEL